MNRVIYITADESFALINLNGKYSSLEFDFDHVDGGFLVDFSLEIYLDSKLVKTIKKRLMII